MVNIYPLGCLFQYLTANSGRDSKEMFLPVPTPQVADKQPRWRTVILYSKM